MASPCNNSPDEVIEKIVSAKANADKFDKFVNGTNMQTVQLGTGDATPTIRNAVRQIKADGEWIKQFIADAPEGDVSLNNVTALGSVSSRTLTERFADVINVKDYGAKGDGVTDDTQAIKDAFNAGGMSGKKVYVPNGDYIISSTIGWNIDLGFVVECGAGVRFVATSNFPSSAKFFWPHINDEGNPSFRWIGGCIDGRNRPVAESGTAPDLLYINELFHRIIIEDVYFLSNDDRDGTAGDSCLFLAEGEDYFISHCIFQGAVDACIYISGDAYETKGRRCTITENTFLKSNVSIISKRSFLEHVISNNMFYDCGFGIVIGGEAGDKKPGNSATITGNQIISCARGIQARGCVEGKGCVIVGNKIFDFGKTKSGDYVNESGIAITGSSNCVVSGNDLYCEQTVVGAGITLNDWTFNDTTYTSDNCLIVGNHVSGGAASFRSDESTGSNNVVLGNFFKQGCRLGDSISFSDNFEKTYRRTNLSGAKVLLNPAAGASTLLESDSTIWQQVVSNGGLVGWLVGNSSAPANGRFFYDITNERWGFRSAGQDSITIRKEGLCLNGVTVDNLPTDSQNPAKFRGHIIFVTNGRKNGQAAGAGTGVLAFHDGLSWKAVDTGQIVEA